jgi:hypothetical protein
MPVRATRSDPSDHNSFRNSCFSGNNLRTSPPEMGADRWSPHHSLHVAVLPIRDDPEPDREDPSTLANEIDAYETPVSLYLHHLTPRIPSF